MVCETLLRHMDISSNEVVWKESLRLVRRIVGGVDYKVHGTCVSRLPKSEHYILGS